VTVSGKECQAWSANTPHLPSAWTDDSYAEGSGEAARNYCRNPDAAFVDGVWCYTMDPSTRWELCDVPLCRKSAADCT